MISLYEAVLTISSSRLKKNHCKPAELLGIVSLSNSRHKKYSKSILGSLRRERTSTVYRARDYQYSTVDSCLKFHSDAMGNLLTFHFLLFYESCWTLLACYPYSVYSTCAYQLPHHNSTLLLSWGWCCLLQLLNFIICVFVPWMPISLSPQLWQHFSSQLLSVCGLWRVELPKCLWYLYQAKKK